MGISVTQYRVQIGLYNSVKIVSCACADILAYITCMSQLLSIAFIVIILLLMSGDIELNPGPVIGNVGDNKLRICHANVRGLREKLDAVKNDLLYNFDIIAITESRLTNTFDESKANFKDYYPAKEFRKDRVSDTGGGIIVFISEALGATRRRDLEHPNLEAMFIEIRSKNNKFILCVCYRAPDSTVQFWDDLQTQIDLSKQGRITSLLITGDLNADPNAEHGPHLTQFAVQNHLEIHIDEPTRITDTSATILDQFISNMLPYIDSKSVLPPVSTSEKTSDHCTISLTLSFHVHRAKAFKRHIWDYKHANFEEFRNTLSDHDWDHCFISDDIDDNVSQWTDTFLNIARNCIPNRIVTIRPDDKPYYTSDLRRLKRKQDRLHTKAKRTNTPEHWLAFRQARNLYNHELESAEKNYNETLALKLKTDNMSSPKKWWNIAKHFLGFKKNSSIPPIKDGDNEHYSNADKATVFNDFFLSHSSLDVSNAELPNQFYYTNNRLNTINILESEVSDILKSLDTSKATGPDLISPKLLKEAGVSIVPCLTRLLNRSLSKCHYPSEWKRANVTPLHKKSDKNIMNNYRPISLLSCVGKILEKIVFKHVFNYLRDHALITLCQSGFIPGDSTVNQLAQIYHLLYKALDEKKDMRIVFLDISKAFDKVWHDGIIFKLRAMGIDGHLLEWFKDYLRQRHQRVVIGSCSSEWGEIKAGVPQGSVLGPLLFLIYINDITSVVQCNIRLFADDTTIFIDIDDPQRTADILNTDLDAISNWAAQWLITFSPPKTESMTITLKDRRLQQPDLYMNDTRITEVDNHKHLGIIFSNDLSWDHHVQHIVAKAGERVDILSRLMYKVDRKTLQTMYFSFIRPKLEYADVVWSNVTEGQSDIIEMVQKRAARITSGAIRGTKTVIVYEELGWDSLRSRREQHKVLFLHKIIHGHSPQYLIDLMPETVNSRTEYYLRNQSEITAFKTRLTSFYNSFFPSAVRAWNMLDPTLRSIQDHDNFKLMYLKNTPAPKELYFYGERGVAVTHARIRMKCSKLKAHLCDHHLIDDPFCSCSESREDELHFFFICPHYAQHRISLHETISEYATFNLHTLLYGRDNLSLAINQSIFEAVFAYIKATKRFE